MYIKVNEKNEIVTIIKYGEKPANATGNWYEVEIDDVPQDVMKDIFSYKYIDGEFVIREDVYELKLSKVKTAKINAMSNNCRNAIIKGFTHSDGHHYSLAESDQLKLIVLGAQAAQGQKTSWKYDNGLCQFYSSEEMLELTKHATNHISYHQTYFNQLKDQIKLMESAEDVIAISYGVELDKDHKSIFEEHMDNYIPNENDLGLDEYDPTDYDSILNGNYL